MQIKQNWTTMEFVTLICVAVVTFAVGLFVGQKTAPKDTITVEDETFSIVYANGDSIIYDVKFNLTTPYVTDIDLELEEEYILTHFRERIVPDIQRMITKGYEGGEYTQDDAIIELQYRLVEEFSPRGLLNLWVKPIAIYPKK
jgi:hypothetical protein